MWVWRSIPSVCLSVCLLVRCITQKRMIPKCSNLVYYYTRSDMLLGLNGQWSRSQCQYRKSILHIRTAIHRHSLGGVTSRLLGIKLVWVPSSFVFVICHKFFVVFINCHLKRCHLKCSSTQPTRNVENSTEQNRIQPNSFGPNTRLQLDGDFKLVINSLFNYWRTKRKHRH